ncbi:triphosphoribosyl-dephospho-CoA synthase [Streptomyces sp. QTS137]
MQSREDEALAQAAVAALIRQLELAPKPGLPDPRDCRAHSTGRDHRALCWSAKTLAPGLTAMAAVARRIGAATPELRTELGAIGRLTEHRVEQAGGGHRGAMWVLGLLVAGAAVGPDARGAEVTAVAQQIAAHRDRFVPRRQSHGASVSAAYGAAGARGEARAGFPHVRRALTALTAARASEAAEPQARLDALLTIMTTLQDTEVLYTTGPSGLREVQAGARRVLDEGGTSTPAGRAALDTWDTELTRLGLSPRGSAALLTGALFVDSLASRPKAIGHFARG